MERSDKPAPVPGTLKPACGDCYFHDSVLSLDKKIRTVCRYTVPILAHVWIPVDNGMSVISQVLWPAVELTDWCGKFSIDKPPN